MLRITCRLDPARLSFRTSRAKMLKMITDTFQVFKRRDCRFQYRDFLIAITDSIFNVVAFVVIDSFCDPVRAAFFLSERFNKQICGLRILF